MVTSDGTSDGTISQVRQSDLPCMQVLIAARQFARYASPTSDCLPHQVRQSDLPSLASHLAAHFDRRPPDHLLFEWFSVRVGLPRMASDGLGWPRWATDCLGLPLIASDCHGLPLMALVRERPTCLRIASARLGFGLRAPDMSSDCERPTCLRESVTIPLPTPRAAPTGSTGTIRSTMWVISRPSLNRRTGSTRVVTRCYMTGYCQQR